MLFQLYIFILGQPVRVLASCLQDLNTKDKQLSESCGFLDWEQQIAPNYIMKAQNETQLEKHDDSIESTERRTDEKEFFENGDKANHSYSYCNFRTCINGAGGLRDRPWAIPAWLQ